MKKFQISRYIKKWLPLIITVCIALTIGVHMFLSSSQTYVASAVINYSIDSTTGLTPAGTELDVSEIKSSSIMARVIDNLGLDPKEYSLDNLISRLSVHEVVDEDEIARKEAMLESGEEYIYVPTTYIVSFQSADSEGEGFARKVLDEVLDVYFSDYSEKYVNKNSTSNELQGLSEQNYDYIEMVELIDSNLEGTIQSLYSRYENDPYFRAVNTGASFSDLLKKFQFVQSVNISKLYSDIFQYQITKDKRLLLSNYRERIKNYNISIAAEEEKIADAVELINAYVEKMRESDNTNITYEYILDDVYDKDHTDANGKTMGKGDQTVTYDKLIYSWRDHNDDKEHAIIDIAYCNYIMEVFGRCTGACGAAADGTTACAASDKTCSALAVQNYEGIVNQVKQDIDNALQQLNLLYDELELTNEEYNEYLGADNISTLSSVSVRETVDVGLYTAIAAAFLLIVCCCGAILLGRLNDILQYAFYTDHLTGFNNRAAFDNYLKENDKRILDLSTVCMAVSIINQPEINKTLGRDGGDKLIRFFADGIRSVFGGTGAYLVYNGKSQFVILCDNMDYEKAESIANKFRFEVETREEFKSCRIEYQMGLAESKKDQVRKIRQLLSKAMTSQEKFTADQK